MFLRNYPKGPQIVLPSAHQCYHKGCAMSDLISKLADDIIALINAKPRSPTRDEIVEVLTPILNPMHPPFSDALRTMIDASLMASYPGVLISKKTLDACSTYQPAIASTRWRYGKIDGRLVSLDEDAAKPCPCTVDAQHKFDLVDGTRSAQCMCGAMINYGP